LVEDGFEIDSLSSDQAQEDETIEHSEEVLKLEECISQLQQNSKDALFMAYYNEMTYENISKAVGFPVNTVKTWVRRSKDFLNRCVRGLH
jgi:RNA polymerase sigma-70 factor (ECF subfamily)